MSSEILGSAENLLKGNLGGAWDVKHGYASGYTDLGLARLFGGSAAAYSLRDIGAMNGRVVKVRREQDNGVADFSASAIENGSIEQFAIGQTVLDLYNNASYSNDVENDFWGLNPSTDTQIDLGSGACSWSCDFVITTDTFGASTTRLCQNYDSSEHFYFSSATQFRWRNPSDTNTTAINLDVTIQKNRKYNIEWIRDASDVVTIKIDGVLQSNNNSGDRNSGQIEIGRLGGFRFVGAAFNWNFNNGQHIYAGDGNTTSNWLDTGSGTTKNLNKFGSPVLFTGQGISAFVDTWYDQSGNGNDATQATANSQPYIISNGNQVTLDNGTPSIAFERITGYDTLTINTPIANEPYTFFATTVNNASNAWFRLFGESNAAPTVLLRSNNTIEYRPSDLDQSGAISATTTSDNIVSGFSGVNGGADGILRFNGTNLKTDISRTQDGDSINLIGRFPNAGTGFAHIESIVFYESDLTSDFDIIEKELAQPINIL